MNHGWVSRARRIKLHNVTTLRSRPLAEVSGSLGDLGTLLPLMIALAVQGSIDLGSTLVFSGLWNVLTGIFFGIPLPVQPMKVRDASHLIPPTSPWEHRGLANLPRRLFLHPPYLAAGIPTWASSRPRGSGSV